MLYSYGISLNLDNVRLAANRLLFYESGNTEKTVSLRWTKA
jgi:hypothetical protein